MIYCDERGEKRTAFSGISIDVDEARMLDDAFDIEMRPHGYLLRIFVVDVISVLEKTSELQKAIEIGFRAYWPLKAKNIFPDKIIKKVSFSENAYRRAIMLEYELNENTEILNFRIERVFFKNIVALSFSQVEQILNSYEEDGLKDKLVLAIRLAVKLAKKQKRKGRLKEWKSIEKEFRTGTTGLASMRDSNFNKGGYIIRQLMEFVNWSFAVFGKENNIPIIYKNMSDDFTELISCRRKIELYRCMQEIGSGIMISNDYYKSFGYNHLYSKSPEEHKGLGYDIYTEFTSPLRSGVCLINQYATSNHFWGIKKVNITDKLETLIDHLNQVYLEQIAQYQKNILKLSSTLGQDGHECFENIHNELLLVSKIIKNQETSAYDYSMHFAKFKVNEIKDWIFPEMRDSLSLQKQKSIAKYLDSNQINFVEMIGDHEIDELLWKFEIENLEPDVFEGVGMHETGENIIKSSKIRAKSLFDLKSKIILDIIINK